MAKGFYKPLTGILKKHGWEFHRQCKGSHEMWIGLDGRKISFPSNVKRRATANDALKQAKIKEKI
ncbi:type II toxin-antitoxin system HicA family toxin [Hyphomonas sp.]|uniref:type II toxin-antitoxin system HicA family toxin n=1 Tax=Hyphomonas sp. TaxID=87 RepID=UPI003002C0D7